MPNLTPEGRLALIDDIQRNYSFELLIPDIGTMTDKEIDQEGFAIRCKNAAIPSRGITTIDSYFHGMKQVFPSRPDLTNALAVSVDETEDQIVMKSIYAWRQKIFDIDPDSTTAGYSKAMNKRSVSTTIILRQYKYNGVAVDNDIHFINSWPSNMGDVALDMSGDGKVMYDITFTWDYWILKPSSSGT